MVDRREDLIDLRSRIPPKECATSKVESEALWVGAVVVCLSTVLSFFLYRQTGAPGLTWAHHGADGGDFLAAAVTGGVPHPSGYPLYTMLLRAWLWAGGIMAPAVTPANLGNQLSALLGALSVGCTAIVAAHVIDTDRPRWWLAGVAGLAWAVSPLLWSQSQITEVYTLHALLASVLAMAIMLAPAQLWLAGFLIGLGIANHMTFVLLLPAVGYYLFRVNGRSMVAWRTVGAVALATAVAATLYLRIPLAAAGETAPPPVNWGYADNLRGFWWLVSGEAYRGAYLGQNAWSGIAVRIAAWARTVTWQYTPVGLLLAAFGLALWDRTRPTLRTFTLLWILPISLYAIVYATQDSEVYLLPASWLLSLLAAVGVAGAGGWAAKRTRADQERVLVVASVMALAGVLAVALVRLPQLTLRQDNDVATYLDSVYSTVEPDSIVVTSSDDYTFAVWYAAWASGGLFEHAPGAVVVNDVLYQFDWYRRLLGDLYPHVPGIGETFADLLAQNAGVRPIYFAEHLDSLPDSDQQPAGDLWRYAP